MTTIPLPASSILRSQYDALVGKPMLCTYALLEPTACPACGGRVRSMGYADWVRSDGIIITLWACITRECSARRDGVTLHLTTSVVDDPTNPGGHCPRCNAELLGVRNQLCLTCEPATCADSSEPCYECSLCLASFAADQATPEETHPVNQTPVAGYGRHNEITIVRHDGSRRSDRFYTLVDRNNRPIGRPWTFLRNARKQAEIRARFLAQGDETGLAVLGMTLEGLARVTVAATASGKTEALLHAINLRPGTHRGARRVWLEGKRLSDAGFRQGVRYQVAALDDGLVLRLTPAGDKRVSGTSRRPVVDLLSAAVTDALGAAEVAHVRFAARSITVTLTSPADRLAAVRLRRLNARLRGGQGWRLGSCSHGAGVASSGLLSGLGRAELAFAVDISPEYIGQSLDHGPLAQGGVSIVSDLRDVDPSDLPECDVLEAGLPCVAASRAGRSKKGLERPEDDPQVEDLEVAFIEILRATQPAVVILENVPEYATSDSAGRIRRWLERWGYVVAEQVLRGAQWSLEARDRWVMVATTRGLTVSLDLTPAMRPATLGEVLDRKVPAAAWRTTEGRDAKEIRDAARGNRFQQRRLTAASTSVPTLRRGYQKSGSTDPRLAHPTRAGYSRLLSAAEHARIKGVSPSLITGLSEKVAHEVLGQSVISPAFTALGAAVAASVCAE